MAINSICSAQIRYTLFPNVLTDTSRCILIEHALGRAHCVSGAAIASNLPVVYHGYAAREPAELGDDAHCSRRASAWWCGGRIR